MPASARRWGLRHYLDLSRDAGEHLNLVGSALGRSHNCQNYGQVYYGRVQ
jgi:hypothetical protein